MKGRRGNPHHGHGRVAIQINRGRKGPDWIQLALWGGLAYFAYTSGFLTQIGNALSSAFRSVSGAFGPGPAGAGELGMPSNTVWISDPANGGTGATYVGSAPPDATTAWREASQFEIQQLGMPPGGTSGSW